MHREEIKISVNKILCEILKDFTIELKEKATIKEFENWDSVAQMTFITRIEEEFKIRFSLKELISINTFKDLIDCIESKFLH